MNYLDQMDVVISATSSPHYTLTYSKMKKQLDDSEAKSLCRFGCADGYRSKNQCGGRYLLL